MQILIAEDDRDVQILLKKLLTNWGYEIIIAENGIKALEILDTPQGRPPIALIDWIMPQMNGVEVIKKFRFKNQELYTYIIMLTAKNSKEDITLALDAGADDYIVKPFHKNELKSRISVGERTVEYKLELHRMNEELLKYSKNMELLAEERAKQLVHADRMSLIGSMAAGIAHEINNPNTSIRINIDILRDLWDTKIKNLLIEKSNKNISRISSDPVYSEGISMIDAIEKGSTRIKKIIKNMKRFSHKKSENFGRINLEECINEAIDICMPKIKTINIEKCFSSSNRYDIHGNNIKITQVIVNLLINAADAIATKEAPEPKISIFLSYDDPKKAEIRVVDNGAGIPREVIKDISKPFFTTKPIGKGTGLGLAISYGIIVNEHGGEIKVSSVLEEGSIFTVHLPRH